MTTTAPINYYKLLKETLLKHDYFRFDKTGNQVTDSAMIDNFCRYVTKSSCDEPKLDPNDDVPPQVADAIKNDKDLIRIIDAIKEHKAKYAEMHISEASLAFRNFKELIEEIKNDPANQCIRESYNEITQQGGILTKLINPDNIMMAIVATYKSKFIGVSDVDRLATLNDFKNAAHLMVKVMYCLRDKSDRKVIISEQDLKETGPDRFDAESCVTEKDFRKSSLTADYFTKAKSISDIFRKISPYHREKLSDYIYKIYTHFICAVFSMRYTVLFTGASSGSRQIYSFGSFLGNIAYHTDLLKPFGFPLERAVIRM